MYEQYDGIKQFKGDFSPCLEVLEFGPVIYVKRKQNSIKPDIKTDEIGRKEQKKEESVETVEEPKQEKGLVVTNNVNYEVKDSEKKVLFKRR